MNAYGKGKSRRMLAECIEICGDSWGLFQTYPHHSAFSIIVFTRIVIRVYALKIFYVKIPTNPPAYNLSIYYIIII